MRMLVLPYPGKRYAAYITDPGPFIPRFDKPLKIEGWFSGGYVVDLKLRRKTLPPKLTVSDSDVTNSVLWYHYSLQ